VVVRLDGLNQPDTDTYGHAVVGAGGPAAKSSPGSWPWVAARPWSAAT
jgi:hypothetical protein